MICSGIVVSRSAREMKVRGPVIVLFFTTDNRGLARKGNRFSIITRATVDAPNLSILCQLADDNVDFLLTISNL